MILIERETDNFFTLTTEKREIGVSFGTRCSVYIKQNGSRRLPAGRHFDTLVEAIDSYKSEEVKSALSALGHQLGLPSYCLHYS